MTTYTRQTWLDGSGGGTPISAARLSYIEAGIATVATAADNGGTTITAQTLIDWTTGEAFREATATYDGNGILSTASVVWPDGSGGTLTVTTANTAFHAIDAYTITHTLSGKTVTQTAVTRDANGNVTVSPALTVA